MDMIDKVAAAIMTAQANRGNLGAQALAAIEAMREMVPIVRENGEVVHELRGSPAAIWAMMFDAALSPGQGQIDAKETK